MSAGVWKEARHSDGRTYYWHTSTKETRWTKPEEAVESELADEIWKEFSTPDGRKYYHNPQTNATVWDMPEAFRKAQAQAQATPESSAPPQQFVAGGSQPNFQQYQPQRDRDDYHERDRGDERRDYGRSDNVRSNFVPATTNEPDYRSYEEAEEAFMKLMKRSNVQPGWSWEEAMRTTIKDQQFRALKDPKERKTAFERYIVEAREQDKEREKERMAKLRDDFTTMLKSHPEIRYNTRWKTARPIIEGETIFRSTGDDTERRQLFEEYVLSLRKAHAESETIKRKAALDDLTNVLHSLDLEPYTRWSDAQSKISSNEQFQNDDKFKTITKSDVLAAFETHIKALERTFNDARQSQKTQKGRYERRNRDQYVKLLRELQTDGKIKAGTKWMQVLPLIENDERYIAMLGQSGSTPLDLFWDIVEEEERTLRGKRNEVLDVLDDKRYEITPKTTLEDFMSIMQGDARTKATSEDDLRLIFERLHEKIVRREEEDKHHAERAQRRAVDALRSRIKHLEPPVRVNDSWEEDVRPRIEKYEEYRALDSDDLRRSALDKVLRRLKEKDADADFDRPRRGERDRDGRSNGYRRTRDGLSRTPELDVYEADRRKAILAREKQYRKSSTTGLSPPPTGSPRRRDRYDDRERYERSRVPSSNFDRDRRPRDQERERSYLNRADPRDGPSKELDYGDGRAGSTSGSTGRRRRGSDADDDDLPSSKRPRRSKTPAEPVEIKEEEALKSGSEEGEIEEV